MGLFGYQLLSGIVHTIIIIPCHITKKKVYYLIGGTLLGMPVHQVCDIFTLASICMFATYLVWIDMYLIHGT